MPLTVIEKHLAVLSRCNRCPRMQKPVVVGRPVASEIMLIGSGGVTTAATTKTATIA